MLGSLVFVPQCYLCWWLPVTEETCLSKMISHFLWSSGCCGVESSSHHVLTKHNVISLLSSRTTADIDWGVYCDCTLPNFSLLNPAFFSSTQALFLGALPKKFLGHKSSSQHLFPRETDRQQYVYDILQKCSSLLCHMKVFRCSIGFYWININSQVISDAIKIIIK